MASGASAGGRVVVVGATNRPDALDPALRRAGRFDAEVRVDPPDAAARAAILSLHARRMPLHPELLVRPRSGANGPPSPYLARLAAECVGFVGADLRALCREAAMAAAARSCVAAGVVDAAAVQLQAAADGAHPLCVTAADFDRARLHVQPSALRGVCGVTVVPHTEAGSSGEGDDAGSAWSAVGGMGGVVSRLRAAVELPMRFPHLYAAMRVAPPRGVLLYGPPGCSKTTLVRALAASVHASFLAVTGAEVYSPYVGEAERTLRALFARAREAAPCIVFLDEIDALVGSRGGIGPGAGAAGKDGVGVCRWRSILPVAFSKLTLPCAPAVRAGDVSVGILATLLTEMDGVQSAVGVTVIGATNRPQALDPALLRPGRLELHLEVPLPASSAQRLDILRVHARTLCLGADVRLELLASEEATGGWSGARLAGLCREAGMEALREALAGSGDGGAGTCLQGIGEHLGDPAPQTPAALRLATMTVSAAHFARALDNTRCEPLH